MRYFVLALLFVLTTCKTLEPLEQPDPLKGCRIVTPMDSHDGLLTICLVCDTTGSGRRTLMDHAYKFKNK